jgi:N-acyl-D-aspartate/D-glutamate deacylase
VWVDGSFVAAVGPHQDSHPAGAEVVDCSGCYIVPGFIDVHSHADNAGLLDDPDASKILQGVTTEVVGNCGMSLAPRAPRYTDTLDRYLGRLFPPTPWTGSSWQEYWRQAEPGLVTNAAPLVGHGTLRVAAMGMDNRPAGPADRRQMRALLREALDAGAFGLSTGLIYPPGMFSDTEELVGLARELGGAVYASHIRNEAAALEQSVSEAINIGREAGVRVQLSHHKASGRRHWGKTSASLALVDAARAVGQDVRLDVYPYTASSTMLTTCLPAWTQEGGDAALLRRLEDPEAVAAMRRDLAAAGPDWEAELAGAGASQIWISATADHQFEGMTLAEAAEAVGGDALDALVAILRAERLRASMVLFTMDEADVERVLAHPWAMIGSDGLPPGVGGRPHPRLYGTFPRVLGRYVREHPLLTWQEAVRKMTGLPADTFGIPDRGYLLAGKVADVVVLRPTEIADAATYDDPIRPPVGIVRVYQAGRLVVEGQQYLGQREGRWLRRAP